ncbi:hypothetical protein ACD591_05420 [Rufibacter glacialis]|uniref:Uncharacterized protein n=1 Tax=Rufibacter glacialis TaxID=1259555 RepID=A0A5M8QII4_9BACT|nr:hypothetical protein [Rufibacter glacialis]KAA6434784.1 hypothetical protein FOE74_11475 [Rufibacter glacialis]GGK72397.1 hypothetical protein GCM10011405_20800 [Rufibacter glacialis]
MAPIDTNLLKIAEARKQVDAASRQLYLDKSFLQKSENPNLSGSNQEKIRASNEAYNIAQARLQQEIESLYKLNNHRAVAAEMKGEVPVLFLPVRLETRFVTLPTGQQELWVRIYPDDFHIHSHEPLLTENEKTAGKQYWTSLVRANREGGEKKEALKKEAWLTFSKPIGTQRGIWVAKQTQPLNWSADLAVADAQVQFKEIAQTKTHAWTMAPRTQLLPDRFAVHLINDNKVVDTFVGAVVPDTVFLGPDPFLAEAAFKKSGTSIELDESFSWLANFDKAVEQGLGLKIPMKPEYLRGGKVERLVVMGLLSSSTPKESQVLLEQVLENHLYSRKGFSLLPQGSATNNTQGSGSAYTKNENYLPKGYYEGPVPSSTAALENTDAAQLARALGVNPAFFQEVNHAQIRDRFEAAAMNQALYSATIGYYMEILAAPILSKQQQTLLREFFTSHVTAAGALPAFRIGDQPYSMLLTSDFTAWEENGRDVFSQGLTGVLKKLQQKWDAITTEKVAHVGRGGNASETMLEILGLDAGSRTFHQRLGHLPDVLLSSSNGSRFEEAIKAKQQNTASFLQGLGLVKPEDENNSMITFLNFYKSLNSIPFDKLVDGLPPAPDRFLEKLGPQKLNFIEWISQANRLNDLLVHNLGTRPPNSILYLMLRHSILQELQTATEEYYFTSNILVKKASFEKSLLNFSTEFKDITSWEVLQGSPSAIDPAKLKVVGPIGDYFLDAGNKAAEGRVLQEMKGAMKVLAQLPTSRLHKDLSDHIDLCTYRLDAWVTGLFQRRLQNNRKTAPEGIYIGAYGWVENLKVAEKKVVEVPEAMKPANGAPVYQVASNAGFVQTPSLNHATAAGVLLAGYQNHATKADPGNFAITLSSERVRRAIFVYEGIQNNQSLEALLGYQFERALHEVTSLNPANNLNQYILSFREKFPINHASIPQQGTVAQETVPAYSVVNGLKIVSAKEAEIASVVPNTSHLALVLKEKNRLEDTMDALNDLLVSETAYQATQGKTDRTAALLNAVKNAEMPPDLEFHRTPRTTHLSFTNRITMHFNPGVSTAERKNWPENPSPRSALEPGLNQWLGTMIGNPADILATAALVDENGVESNSAPVSLADLKLQPIDLIYAVGTDRQSGAQELEARLEQVYTATTPVPAKSRLKISFGPEVAPGKRTLAQAIPLLRALRVLLTGARAASAKDFSPRTKTEVKDAGLLYGWEVTDLKTRASRCVESLALFQKTVESTAPNESATAGTQATTFQGLFTQYHQKGADRSVLEKVTVSANGSAQLHQLLATAPLYGIKTTFVENAGHSPETRLVDLLSAAAGVWQNINQRLQLAQDKMAKASSETNPNTQVTRLTEAVKAVLGDDFLVIPRFRYLNPADVSKVLGDEGNQLLRHINKVQGTTNELAVETWLESVAAVRQNMKHLEQVRMLSEAQAETDTPFTAAQFPPLEVNSWLAVEFPEINEKTGEKFDILDDTISMAIHGAQSRKVEELQSALLIDEWTEAIPNDKEISGVAFNYDQPNASAPNALLLAVEPKGAAKWNWDVLLGILNNTLSRAKTRAVEPSHLMADAGMENLIPMTVARFDVKEANVSLDYLASNDNFLEYIARQKFELYRPYTQ